MLGIAVGFTDVDYGSLWARNLRVRDDEGKLLIRTGQGWDNAEQIRQNLTGTTTSEQTVLPDNLFGHQLLFGVDYALTQSISFGVKGRWVRFEMFRDTGSWDRLRSHDSILGVYAEPGLRVAPSWWKPLYRRRRPASPGRDRAGLRSGRTGARARQCVAAHRPVLFF